MEAEINGVKVGNDALVPGWSNYNQRVECFTYDVTDELQSGANALGFWLGDGWYRGRLGFDGGYSNFYGDHIAVFAQLEVEYADGSMQNIYSNAWDRQWKATLGPIVCSDLCEGERYDARLEQPGWSKPGFDDSSWQPVAEVMYDPARIENPETSPVRAHESHERSASNASATRKMVVAYGWLTSDRTVRSASACTCAILKQNKA